MELSRTGDGQRWIQVAVPTGDPDVRRIKAELKKRWRRVWVTPMGVQITRYGLAKLTMINGRND